MSFNLGEAILLESALISFKSPTPRILEAFRNVFHNKSDDKKEPYPTLGGQDAGILDDANDLMALRIPPGEDRLTTFLRDYLPFLFVVSCSPNCTYNS